MSLLRNPVLSSLPLLPCSAYRRILVFTQPYPLRPSSSPLLLRCHQSKHSEIHENPYEMSNLASSQALSAEKSATSLMKLAMRLELKGWILQLLALFAELFKNWAYAAKKWAEAAEKFTLSAEKWSESEREFKKACEMYEESSKWVPRSFYNKAAKEMMEKANIANHHSKQGKKLAEEATVEFGELVRRRKLLD